MTQNNISRLESPDYGNYSLASLRRIAGALDVGLVVRFVPFSQYVDWLSSTPHLDYGLSPEALAPASFEQEEKRRVYDRETTYYSVIQGPKHVSPAVPIASQRQTSWAGAVGQPAVVPASIEALVYAGKEKATA